MSYVLLSYRPFALRVISSPVPLCAIPRGRLLSSYAFATRRPVLAYAMPHVRPLASYRQPGTVCILCCYQEATVW